MSFLSVLSGRARCRLKPQLLSTPSSSLSTRLTLLNPIRYFASKKHKATLRLAKGFRGRANRCFKLAINRVEKSWIHAYRHRKLKKRDYRRLWIQRVNAGARQHGMRYNEFMNGAGRAGVGLDRKILADLAANEPFSFKAVVDVVKLRIAGGTR
mmetsp:Transcript_51950/g.62470  ORF Transcript_51950/g.62470 Transcript_51950/m.62470 type:complete len:154 (-) Transcript_51950:150-611(-)